MAAVRAPIIVVLAANLTILVIATVFTGSVLGFGKLHALGFYREVDNAGVIDHQQLTKFRSGQFADPWYVIPEHMVGFTDRVMELQYVICGLAILSTASVLILWRRVTRLRGRSVREAGADRP